MGIFVYGDVFVWFLWGIIIMNSALGVHGWLFKVGVVADRVTATGATPTYKFLAREQHYTV